MKFPAAVALVLCLFWVPGLTAQDGGKAKKTEVKKPVKNEPKKSDKSPREKKDGEQPDSSFKIFPAPDGRAYFPKGSESYYTKYLAAMKEPSLQPKEKETEGWSLRFTWLRTFHKPIAVRLWKDGDEIQMRAVRMSGKGGYDPGKVEKEVVRKLTVEERKQMEPLLESKDLWKPLTKDEDALTSGGLDGAPWIFERRTGGTYTMVEYWCPKDLNPESIKRLGFDPAKVRDFAKIAEAGLLLLKPAGLVPAEGEIY
jgi:hypothetical protein